jgi:hypothetical protein
MFGITSRDGPYRDGIGALRREVRGAAKRLMQRGSELDARDRRRLPRRLRQELRDHERALLPEVDSVGALREQEARVADYESALEVADTWLDSRRELLRRGRVHFAPAALALLAAVAPLGTMMALRYGAVSIHCNSRRAGMPNTPNMHALVDADAPRCVAESDIDCALLCQLRGLCVERQGACVADDAELCRASVGCAVEDACSLRNGACRASAGDARLSAVPPATVRR